MSRIDDRLSERFRATTAPRVEVNPERIAERTRGVGRRRRVGTAALVVVVVAGTLGGYALLDRAFEGRADQPATLVSAENGCRSVRIDGTFSSGLDSAWILEEGGDAACEGNGPQYVGVGTADGAVIVSSDISDIPLGDIQRALWPYATPDIDGDGFDEIAVGIGGSRTAGWVDIKLFRVDADAGQIVEMAWEGDSQLDRSQPIGIGTQGPEAFGAYCGALEGSDGTVGLVSWSAGVTTHWNEVRAFLYVPDDAGTLVFHDSGGWETPVSTGEQP